MNSVVISKVIFNMEIQCLPDFVVDSPICKDFQCTNLVQNLRLVKVYKIMNDDVRRPEKLREGLNIIHK